MGRYKRQLKVTNSGYGEYGASRTKRSLRGFVGNSLSPQKDIDPHNKTLRQRARSLFIGGSPIATSAIRSLRTSVVGPGLHLHAQVDTEILGITHEQAATLNRQIEREFEIWANDFSADISGGNTFYDLQQIALMSWRMSGDVFAVFGSGKPTTWQPYSLRIKLVEADRVCTPGDLYTNSLLTYGETKTGNKIFDGVEIDKATGQVVAYYICNTFPGTLNPDEPTKWQRVERIGRGTGQPNILHIYEAERPEQYRGVTAIAPVIESVLQMGEYLKAEQVAALLETYLTGYITTDKAADAPIFGDAGSRPPGLPVTTVGTTEDEEEAERDLASLDPEPGVIKQLLPGESITFNDPKRPNGNFDPFIRALATYIGAAMEIPVDVLLKSYNSSYSASRAALQDFWRKVMMDRDVFATRFCAPIFAAWMAEAVAKGRINAPGFFTDPALHAAYLRHTWYGPTMPHLDPEKEANAYTKMVEQGFMTRTEAVERLTGGDYIQNAEQLAKETELFLPILTMLNSANALRYNTTTTGDTDNADT